MSKKQFTSGLDSVFSAEAQYEPNIDESPWLLETSIKEEPASTNTATAAPRRRAGKSFTSDLDSLFANASVELTIDEEGVREDPTVRSRTRPRRRVGVLSGLDSLIRDTTGGKAFEQQAAAAAEDTPVRKRVTFTYNRDRFSRLKSIARNEGAYLKDIISGLLNEYIQKYEKEHGPVTI